MVNGIKNNRLEKSIKEDFIKHIYIDFSHYTFSHDGLYMLSESREKQRLYEARGLFPNLYEIVNIIWRAVESEAMGCEPNKSCHIEKAFIGNDLLFINYLDIVANFTYVPGEIRGSGAANNSNGSLTRINGL